MLLCRRDTGFFGLVRRFELHVLLDDLRHIFFGRLHIPEPFGPNHHVGAKCADVEATASNHANLAFEIALLADFSKLFDDFFRATVAARRAFTVAVIDAHVDLPDIRLWALNHGFSLRMFKPRVFIAEKKIVCTRPGINYFIHGSSISLFLCHRGFGP